MLKREQSALLVVDLQDKLMPPDAGERERVFGGASRMVQAARILGVPIVLTEQNPQKLGATSEKMAGVLQGVTPIAKMEFGALGNELVVDALAKTGRKQLVIVGIETHICVLQTALGAVEQGYTPYVVRDAVGARKEEEHAAGLARMSRHGAGILTIEMCIFEWLGVAGTKEFREILPLLK